MELVQNKELTAAYRRRAEELVAQMTLEEKVMQTMHHAPAIERLGIKAYNWWNEALHGVARAGTATVFPQAVGMAAAFDEELMEQVGDAVSTEARAKFVMQQEGDDEDIYKGLTFWAPNVNIFRDPRWGRGHETFGEDPYLTSRLGVRYIMGLQGHDEKYLKTAACAKHFAVHSGPEKVRHEFDAVASPKDMEETYLPAFKRLVDCGVEGFMGAYNRTNGEPCCGSRTLLAELLRRKWGFKGYITSDCWAVSDFHLHHGVTVTPTDSVQLALENGCDLNCGNMYAYIMQAYEEGKITEEMIRTSCTRLLTTRMKLGMFDQKTPFDAIGMEVVDCEAHRAVNEEMTRASMVLLKNNGILPLDKKKIRTIAVIGPNANSINALEGNYHGTANQYITVLEGIRAEFAEARIHYCEGSHLYEYKLEEPGYAGDRLGEVKGMTDEADVVILVTGLDETIEGEEMADREMGGDKADLYLPQCQQDLVRTACERKTPVVLVNLSGSAIDFAYGNDHADAIIQAWYPGGLGGKVIAELLAGKYSPSGRLPVTFYHNESRLPEFTNYSMDGRTYKFLREDPLFPFGFGLSYTSFAYSGLKLSDSFRAGEKVSGSVRVKNTGAVPGREVIQVYVRDMEASVRVPHHKLCQFQSVFLQPGEEREVAFEIDAEQFEIIRDDGSRVYEPGVFGIFVGGSQPDAYSEELAGSKTVHRDITMQ